MMSLFIYNVIKVSLSLTYYLLLVMIDELQGIVFFLKTELLFFCMQQSTQKVIFQNVINL